MKYLLVRFTCHKEQQASGEVWKEGKTVDVLGLIQAESLRRQSLAETRQ